MRNEKIARKSNKTYIKTTIIFMACCIILSILLFTSFNQISVYADYEDLTSDSILNFNQLIQINSSFSTSSINGLTLSKVNDYTLHIEGTATASTYLSSFNQFFYISPATDSTHIFYTYIAQTLYSGSNYLINVCGTASQGYQFILSDNLSRTYYYGNMNLSGTSQCLFSNNNYYNVDFIYNAIDLTRMFGSGNEPDLTQCQEIFVADYYAYNAGTAISKSGLEQFTNGVNYALKDTTITYTSEQIVNNAQPYYNSYRDSFIKYYTETGNYPETRYTDTLVFYNAAYVSLPATFEVGTHITFSALSLATNSNLEDMPLSIYYLDDNNNLTLVDAINEATYNYSISFVNSNKIIGFVFMYNSSSNGYEGISEPIITFTTNNISALIGGAYSKGYSDAETYYKSYYSINGEGYDNIYNLGYQAGYDAKNGNIFTDTWSYISMCFSGVGDILAIELLPNMPIGLFVAIPLLVGLIFFIVKFAKGSGG